MDKVRIKDFDFYSIILIGNIHEGLCYTLRPSQNPAIPASYLGKILWQRFFISYPAMPISSRRYLFSWEHMIKYLGFADKR